MEPSKELDNDLSKRLNQLASFTHLVPFFDKEINDKESKELLMPFFNSLEHLLDSSSLYTFNNVKPMVIAKLNGFATKQTPSMRSVFVLCRECLYINLAPFDMAMRHKHQSELLKSIMHKSKYQQQHGNLLF